MRPSITAAKRNKLAAQRSYAAPMDSMRISRLRVMRHLIDDARAGGSCLSPKRLVSGYVCVWTVGDAVAARTRSARSVRSGRSTRSATGAGTGVGTGEGGVALLAAAAST